MHEVARCTCPYHLRRRVRRTAVISSRSSFWRSTAEEISSSSFAPQIHLIMARSFLRSRCRSEAFGAQVSLPWSIVDRTQAKMYILKRNLSGRNAAEGRLTDRTSCRERPETTGLGTDVTSDGDCHGVHLSRLLFTRHTNTFCTWHIACKSLSSAWQQTREK